MNVLMISIDNLRFDCVGYQPDKRELKKHDVLKYLETPVLDSIAEKSLCFTQCISTNTYTTASHASIFTGLYPPRHGVRAFYDTKLAPGVTTLAEIFKRNGYTTVMYTDSIELFRPLELNRGFDFEYHFGGGGVDEQLFSLLRSLKDKKIFLFVHFMDVHEPFLHNSNGFRPGINEDYLDEMFKLCSQYEMLDSFDKTARQDMVWNRLLRGPLRNRPIDILFPLYARGVTKFDTLRLSYFVDAVSQEGFLNDAATIILSDHGEGRCHADKGYFSHGEELYDNVLRIPFMLAHPDLKPGTDDRLISTVDVFPTLLSMLHIEDAENIDGVDILSGKRNTVYAETWGMTGEFSVTDDRTMETADSQGAEFLLRQKMVRSDRHKYVLYNKGKTRKFFEANKDLPDHEYVKRLYRDILGRFEGPGGYQHHMNLLKQGAKTKKELFHAFLNSAEYKALPVRAVYDLRKDEEEDHPLPINPLSWKISRHFTYMEELERTAVISEKIFDDTGGAARQEDAAVRREDDRVGAGVFTSLDEKEAKAISIIKHAAKQFGIEQIGVAWTGGKDSTTVLHLIKQAFNGHIPLKVINIDTSVKFPEIYEFRERLHREWGFDLRVFRNADSSKWLQLSKDHAECCYQLKTVPLNQAITSLGLKALVTGVRWDEQEARSDEQYLSPRENPDHVRVQPILHFKESDIWDYIKKYRISYCALYDKGYRSLGCAPCTSPSSGTGPERSGRAQDKEKIMARLRELGYF